MSITDELREAIGELRVEWIDLAIMGPKPTREDFTAIADRIDTEHEAACAEAYGNGVMSVALPDMTAYVKLPKDADGVPIHVGDVLTDGEHTFVVGELATFGNGSWSIRNENENAWKACDVTHHHKPTVEDVLREFAEKVTDSQVPGVRPTYEEAISEYASRLRLAEGDA